MSRRATWHLVILGITIGFTAWTKALEAQDSARPAEPDRVSRLIAPSAADPAISRFDEPNYVVFDRHDDANASLVVFLPGSNGRPANAELLLNAVAGLGYRAIGLEYNDAPAVAQVCHTAPPRCSQDFREKRTFGRDATAAIDDAPAESIVNRLVKLLLYLDRQYPGEAWGRYLAGGTVDWSRIVVSGLSQGAGMAAYIAKSKPVARVVLFSSPWDFYGRSQTLAPWLFAPAATPPDRWFAEYHRRENTAEVIARAYKALRIPQANIRIFDLDLAPGLGTSEKNPFHGSTIRDPRYLPEWQFLFGSPAGN